eukprot:1013248-Pelagomonas_calceolata.AAC.3
MHKSIVCLALPHSRIRRPKSEAKLQITPLGPLLPWTLPLLGYGFFPLPPCLFALIAAKSVQDRPSLYPPESCHFVVLVERVAHWADSLGDVATPVSCAKRQQDCCPEREDWAIKSDLGRGGGHTVLESRWPLLLDLCGGSDFTALNRFSRKKRKKLPHIETELQAPTIKPLAHHCHGNGIWKYKENFREEVGSGGHRVAINHPSMPFTTRTLTSHL